MGKGQTRDKDDLSCASHSASEDDDTTSCTSTSTCTSSSDEDGGVEKDSISHRVQSRREAQRKREEEEKKKAKADAEAEAEKRGKKDEDLRKRAKSENKRRFDQSESKEGANGNGFAFAVFNIAEFLNKELDDFDDALGEERPPKRQPLPKKDNSLKSRIENSTLTEQAKEEALDALEDIKGDGNKCKTWIETLLKIPFNKYDTLPVTKSSSQEQIQSFFQTVQSNLDAAVYGMKQVKEEIINYVAQFISTDSKSMPRILGLVGEAGVGKSKIIRAGFSQALHRKMQCISMGGIRDSAHFIGFDYTYQGSRHGIIVQSLIDCGVCNPIFYFDELDKISDTAEGHEIQNILIHLTDPVQNHAFHDKYFGNIDIDLSKAIIVFSYNDEKLISPILRDRIHTIHVPTPSRDEKKVIVRDYLLKEVLNNLGMKEGDVILPEETIHHLVTRYSPTSSGVRNLKRCLETLCMKINTARFLGQASNQRYKCFKQLAPVTLPVKITISMCDECMDVKPPEEDKYLLSMYL